MGAKLTMEAVEALGYANRSWGGGDCELRALLAWLYAAGASDETTGHLGRCYTTVVTKDWTDAQRLALAQGLQRLATDALGVQRPKERLGGAIHPANEAWYYALDPERKMERARRCEEDIQDITE